MICAQKAICKATVNNDQSPIYFAEDMIKSDHEMKLKARNHMKAAHDAGRKVCFRRGKPIIDSRVTEITGLDKTDVWIDNVRS